jgi:hypothetical protein
MPSTTSRVVSMVLASSTVMVPSFAHHLGAHVLVGIVEFDLLGDGDAVLGDLRGAELLVDHHIAALGTEGDLDGAGEDGDAVEHLAARGFVEQNLLLGHVGVV